MPERMEIDKYLSSEQSLYQVLTRDAWSQTESKLIKLITPTYPVTMT